VFDVWLFNRTGGSVLLTLVFDVKQLFDESSSDYGLARSSGCAEQHGLGLAIAHALSRLKLCNKVLDRIRLEVSEDKFHRRALALISKLRR
jgi:hypothetical protein